MDNCEKIKQLNSNQINLPFNYVKILLLISLIELVKGKKYYRYRFTIV